MLEKMPDYNDVGETSTLKHLSLEASYHTPFIVLLLLFRIQVAPGLNYSILEYDAGMQLEMDIGHRIFPTLTLYDMWQEKLQSRSRSRRVMDDFEREILGARVFNM